MQKRMALNRFQKTQKKEVGVSPYSASAGTMICIGQLSVFAS